MIFIGDSLYSGKEGTVGYGAILQSWLLMQRPQSCPWLLNVPGDSLSAQDVFEKIPSQVIGKAPDGIFLGFGSYEIELGWDQAQLESLLNEIRFLLEDKVRAQTWIANVPTALYQGEPELLARCKEWNQLLRSVFGNSSLQLLDLDSCVQNFIGEMGSSEGEKRSLHRSGPQYTHLGSLVAASYIGKYILRSWEQGNQNE
jgi:hypothetical protein